MDQCSYNVNHYTDFFYNQPIQENVFMLNMMPLQDENQTIDSYDLKITPKANVSHYEDQYGNVRHCFNILQDHKSLKIHSSFQATVKDSKKRLELSNEKDWEKLKELKESGQMWDWFQFGHFTKVSEELKRFLLQEKIEKTSDPLTSLKNLNSKLFSTFIYTPEITNANSPIEEILTSKKGVCQDYAHVMITIARFWGIASRYVSGYLYQDEQDNSQVLVNQTHAWCECYVPSLGWLGFDPTNNTMTNIQYIKTSIGKDYKEAAPHNGFFKRWHDG